MRTKFGLALLLVCTVATGCGGSGDGGNVEAGQGTPDSSTTSLPAETTTQPTTTVKPTATTATTAGATTTTELSVLRRRDARPGSVQELGNPYIGGPPAQGADCVFGNDAPVGSGAAIFVFPKMVLGEANTICLSKFTGTANVSVGVKRADASTWTAQVSPKPRPDEQLPSVDFFTMPADATGTYTVTATQGTLKATGTFVVDYAVDRHILVVAESPGRGVASLARGKPVHIGVAGWKAGQRVELSLHYSSATTPGDNAKFITLISVTVDARGQKLHTLPTRTDDPKGCYVVNIRPTETPQDALGRGANATFCLS